MPPFPRLFPSILKRTFPSHSPSFPRASKLSSTGRPRENFPTWNFILLISKEILQPHPPRPRDKTNVEIFNTPDKTIFRIFLIVIIKKRQTNGDCTNRVKGTNRNYLSGDKFDQGLETVRLELSRHKLNDNAGDSWRQSERNTRAWERSPKTEVH